jgi:hypothetical protein
MIIPSAIDWKIHEYLGLDNLGRVDRDRRKSLLDLMISLGRDPSLRFEATRLNSPGTLV